MGGQDDEDEGIDDDDEDVAIDNDEEDQPYGS